MEIRKQPTVLVADDDPNVVKLLSLYLRDLDVRVVTATDGEEALAVAEADLPAVVLLDVQMPKRTGWDVCQELKAVRKTSAISVILITGKGEVKDRLTGLQVGADDYLVKPFSRDEVKRRVSAQLEKHANDGRGGEISAEALQALLYDRATDLPTVAATLSRVKETVIEQAEIGILFVDVEQFESIEAEYGWAFFDEFLSTVGDVLMNESRQRFGNSIVATDRVASASFFIFVPTKGRSATESDLDNEVDELRQRLMQSLRGRFPKMRSGQIGVFGGAARVDYDPHIRLERQIYAGMKRAADAVRDAEQEKKRQLTRELRDIIKRKQVKTLFQPIVHASDRTIFGYEILTRGPGGSSFRNSDMLFAFAREMHLSWELEAVALEISMPRLRNAHVGNKKFLVNLEAEMFQGSNIRLRELVALFEEHPGRFVFELTERAAIEDYEAFRDLLKDFREKGIEIAIDDAGSGYASLEAIASIAPDYLKVTKGLVSTLPTEAIKQDLIRMLVDLSKKIGAKTIAEGIETREEYEWCKRLGIDLLQGYYFARPTEEFVDRIPPRPEDPFRPLPEAQLN